jgi:hypothetical protein
MPAGYPSTNGSTKIKSFLKTELLSKAGSDYNWMKQYSLLLLRTSREMENFLKSQNSTYVTHFRRILKSQLASNQNLSLIFGQYLPKTCMGSHIGLANELLITAVQTIWVSHDQIIYKYMLPIVIINELVVIIITILVYSNRNEIEICSRNNAFLLQLFTSLNLASVTALLLGLIII